jgi:V8-like Glu-specific endopeptidase
MLATRGDGAEHAEARRRLSWPVRLRARQRRPASWPLTVATLVLFAVAGAVGSPIPTAADIAAARHVTFGQTSPVGVLFDLTAPDRLGRHYCTASVVDSPAGDLVITAAHCVGAHTPGAVAFVPDYANGKTPYGIWTVTRVITNQQWQVDRNPDDDFAFLIVSQPSSPATLQALTGGEEVAIGEPAGEKVDLVGYPDDQNTLIRCENTVLAFSVTQFQVDCGGFTGGTSGSPFLADVGSGLGVEAVVGVLGGYQHGGLSSAISYAARFDGQLGALYEAAIADGLRG